MKKCVCFVLCLLMLSCSSAYRAQPKGGLAKWWNPAGYSEQQIDDDTYLVSFLSPSNANAQQNFLRAMYRAAEIAIEHDYCYFKVLNNQSTRDTPLRFASDAPMNLTDITVRFYHERIDDTVINAMNYIGHVKIKK